MRFYRKEPLKISHYLAKFGGHRGFCSGDMMFSVVEGQDFTCFCLIPPLLFFFKERHLLCSHKQNFKIKRTLNKKIDSMFNEKKKRSWSDVSWETNDKILTKKYFYSSVY